VVQVVECLPSKYDTEYNPGTTTKKGEKIILTILVAHIGLKIASFLITQSEKLHIS
jgi:hypothetical protein